MVWDIGLRDPDVNDVFMDKLLYPAQLPSYLGTSLLDVTWHHVGNINDWPVQI